MDVADRNEQEPAALVAGKMRPRALLQLWPEPAAAAAGCGGLSARGQAMPRAPVLTR